MTATLHCSPPPEDVPLRVLESAEELADHADLLADESQLAPGRVASLALPRTVAELQRALAWHAARDHLVTVSGGRTGVVGGATADDGHHVVSLSRLSGATIAADDATATALAGTPLQLLDEQIDAERRGLFLPVDPTETSASIGGMVATNASGPRTLAYGPTRAWVAGLQVVLVDGGLLDLRRGEVRAAGGQLTLEGSGPPRHLTAPPIPKPATKHALGYSFDPTIDAVDLFVGSEGTLAVIAAVELSLAPRPADSLYLLQPFAGEDAALDFVEWLRGSFPPAGGGALARAIAIESFDRRSLQLAREAHTGATARLGADDVGAAIYAELELTAEDALDPLFEQLGAAVARGGSSTEASVAGTDLATWRELKAARHAVPERINALIARRRRRQPGLHKIATDMAVPDEQLRPVVALFRRRLTAAGLDHAAFGHVGNNHLHVNILPRDAAQLEQAKEIYLELAAEVVALGGAVSAEHGIGRLKRPLLAIQYAPEVLETMRTIKRFFDPGWRLNRGVLL